MSNPSTNGNGKTAEERTRGFLKFSWPTPSVGTISLVQVGAFAAREHRVNLDRMSRVLRERALQDGVESAFRQATYRIDVEGMEPEVAQKHRDAAVAKLLAHVQSGALTWEASSVASLDGVLIEAVWNVRSAGGSPVTKDQVTDLLLEMSPAQVNALRVFKPVADEITRLSQQQHTSIDAAELLEMF